MVSIQAEAMLAVVRTESRPVFLPAQPYILSTDDADADLEPQLSIVRGLARQLEPDPPRLDAPCTLGRDLEHLHPRFDELDRDGKGAGLA